MEKFRWGVVRTTSASPSIAGPEEAVAGNMLVITSSCSSKGGIVRGAKNNVLLVVHRSSTVTVEDLYEEEIVFCYTFS